MKQVARELDVRFVVEGSVRRMGERIRISAQLIDAAAGSHIWSEKFDRGLDEIFSVQDRVVQTIVSTLVGRVEASDIERARRKPPLSLAACECVLKANSLSWDDPEGEAEAVATPGQITRGCYPCVNICLVSCHGPPVAAGVDPVGSLRHLSYIVEAQ
jgi:hypothetical protein